MVSLPTSSRPPLHNHTKGEHHTKAPTLELSQRGGSAARTLHFQRVPRDRSCTERKDIWKGQSRTKEQLELQKKKHIPEVG